MAAKWRAARLTLTSRCISSVGRPRRKGERSQSIVRGRLKTRRHRANTGATKAYKFLQRGADMLPAALGVFLAKIGPAIEKLNRPKAPAP